MPRQPHFPIADTARHTVHSNLPARSTNTLKPTYGHVTERNAYILEFNRHLRQCLQRKLFPAADDVAQAETCRLIAKIDRVMADYERPTVYANIRVQHTLIDWQRRENAQRGAGSRAARFEGDRLVSGRQVISGDAPLADDSASSLFDSLPSSGDDLDDLVAEEADRQRLLEAALLSVDPTSAEVLRLTLAQEFTDEEAALVLGLSRETVNRKKNRAIRQIRGRFGPDTV